MKRIGKRGQWQNYLLPAILAILVLGISFYFIFNEYFTGDDSLREVCRQSILVRSAMPEIKKAGFNIVSLKEQFPIKCKTDVIRITGEDVEEGRVDNIIGDALAECWYIFGSGDGNVFPSDIYGKTTTCIPCARIHLEEEAKELIKKDEKMKGKIDIEGLLNGAKFDNKFFYLNYLKGSGKLFEPFNPAFNNPFNLSGDKFKIKNGGALDLKKVKSGEVIDMGGEFSKVTLPKYLDVRKGDLIIVLGELTTSGTNEVSEYVPYMFYFQNGQSDYPSEMKSEFYDGWIELEKKICNAWEGIPA